MSQGTATKKNKGMIIVLVIIVVIAALIFFLTADMRAYSKASKLEEAGSYTEAISIYETIPDYKDARRRINECNYQIALALESEGNYADALSSFEALDGYSDAPAHANECNYQIALSTEKNGSATEAMTIFTSLGVYKDSAGHASDIEAAITDCNAEIERIATQRTEYDAAVTVATSLLDKGETPLDPETITMLNQALSAGADVIIDPPKLPAILSDITNMTQELSVIDYTAATSAITERTTALGNSILQYDNVNAPTEEFVIDRLMRVPVVAYVDAATEDNDPNDQLGKAGGYMAQVYFSSTMVSSGYASMPDMDVIAAGTDCGGSIEVYATVEDAERRETYLSSFDGTPFSSGSHTIVGTLLVRTSSKLTASEQKELETAVIDSLTSLNPGPIIQRVVVDSTEGASVPNTDSPSEDTTVSDDSPASDTSADGVIVASSPNLVTISECGYSVENGLLHYSFIAHNNTDTAIEFPEFRITTLDADGRLLGVESQILMVIYPGQDVVWASLGGEIDAMPASIEVEFVNPEPYNLVNPNKLDHPEYIPLEVHGATLKKDEYSSSLIGEITNPNDYAITGAAICIIFRDSNLKLLGGDNGFIDDVGAGETVPFEFYVSPDISTDSYEVYATLW